jgi:division protein CdvB (Snf7/Vps24/ESCRT-III family)
MQANMTDFQRQMMASEVNEGMMDDLLGDAFDADEGEVDDVVNRTLMELGVDLTKDLKSAPTSRIAAKEEEQVEDAEVEKLMRELLKG